MTKSSQRWAVRVTAAVASDFEHIIEWIVEHFGESQALADVETLSLAIEALTEGPLVTGARQRDEILKGLQAAVAFALGFDAE